MKEKKVNEYRSKQNYIFIDEDNLSNKPKTTVTMKSDI